MILRNRIMLGLIAASFFTAIYSVIVGVAMIFTGLPEDATVLNTVGLLIFIVFFFGGTLADTEYENTSMGRPNDHDREFYTRIELIVVSIMFIPSFLFFGASFFQGIIYTIMTFNVIGIVVFIIVVIVSYKIGLDTTVLYSKIRKPFDMAIYWGICLVMFNGVMKSLTTFSLEGFALLCFLNGIVVLLLLINWISYIPKLISTKM